MSLNVLLKPRHQTIRQSDTRTSRTEAEVETGDSRAENDLPPFRSLLLCHPSLPVTPTSFCSFCSFYSNLPHAHSLSHSIPCMHSFRFVRVLLFIESGLHKLSLSQRSSMDGLARKTSPRSRFSEHPEQPSTSALIPSMGVHSLHFVKLITPFSFSKLNLPWISWGYRLLRSVQVAAASGLALISVAGMLRHQADLVVAAAPTSD
ncbi:hypothetical protein RRG08_043735 [Elysia crispata]|uniref:Uncharacterized protein n=1 Tax=Elysia crispata TaxID=231223 RepID=A0AAE0ZN92_9GAST|nr:hypothetical protein RRG08_043735 [Elysia crispata]